MNSLKAGLKALGLAAVTLILTPPQLVLLGLCRREAALSALPQLWHRAACRILGLRVETAGAPVRGRQAVFVGNHLSHLDVDVLNSILRVSFVAKADVRGWPVFGLLGVASRTVFISRARGDAAAAKVSFAAALAQGRSFVLFPEGTSSAGESVLPFKSSLFGPLQGTRIAVQPFTLLLLDVDGRPADSLEVRDIYAYHRDMTFGPHLWNFMKGSGARVRIVFHAPLDSDQDRKTLAAEAHAAVLTGF